MHGQQNIKTHPCIEQEFLHKKACNYIGSTVNDCKETEMCMYSSLSLVFIVLDMGRDKANVRSRPSTCSNISQFPHGWALLFSKKNVFKVMFVL